VARPNWEYVRIDVLMPEHPKIEGLSDGAFRVLVELWCYCGRNRTDGVVSEKRWKATGTPRARSELVKAGLAEPRHGEGCVMHDFTGPDGHQRSKAEIEELAAIRSDSGRKAANARWGHTKTHGRPHD
jgi:hypothetical protein